MSFPILNKRQLSEIVFSIDVQAPQIAKKHQPGQFVLLRVNETGERIPLTIVEANTKSGSITLIFQVVGKTTSLLRDLSLGDEILDVVGPLGSPSRIENFGKVVGVGGGIGLAALYPIIRALKEKGNHVLMIMGAQRADLLILEKEFQLISDTLMISTDDGSKGHRGLVTDLLKNILETGEQVGLVTAVGPVPMMKAVAQMTRPANIKTVVSLNSIMIDGTGMCGGCRVTIGGAKQLTCVEGPEFDGHLVDFDNLSQRLKAYKELEICSQRKYQQNRANQ